MAVTAKVYPKFNENALKKSVNISTDTCKVMLLSAYTFAATHSTMADVKGAGTEATGTGYSAGGATLSGVSISTATNVTTLDFTTDPSWSSSTITASYAVFYDAAGGTDATNYPICYWDFGGAQSSNNGTFTLTINASGLATWTSA